MVLSLFAAISDTTALNMVFDRDIDAHMARTAARPLPSGTVSPIEGTIFGDVRHETEESPGRRPGARGRGGRP